MPRTTSTQKVRYVCDGSKKMVSGHPSTMILVVSIYYTKDMTILAGNHSTRPAPPGSSRIFPGSRRVSRSEGGTPVIYLISENRACQPVDRRNGTSTPAAPPSEDSLIPSEHRGYTRSPSVVRPRPSHHSTFLNLLPHNETLFLS